MDKLLQGVEAGYELTKNQTLVYDILSKSQRTAQRLFDFGRSSL